MDKNNIIEAYSQLHINVMDELKKNQLNMNWLSKQTQIPYPTLRRRLKDHSLSPDMMVKIFDVFKQYNLDHIFSFDE